MSKKTPERTRAATRRFRDRHPGRVLYHAAKKRARERDLVFSIRPEDVVVPERCPVLGLQLRPSVGARTHNSPSLDRIDSTRGYEPDNIRVISWRANQLKYDATLEELKAIVADLEKIAHG